MQSTISSQSRLFRWLRRAAFVGASTTAICWLASLFFAFTYVWCDDDQGGHWACLSGGNLELTSLYNWCCDDNTRCGGDGSGNGSCTEEHFWDNFLVQRKWPPESLGFVLPSSTKNYPCHAQGNARYECCDLPLWIPLLICATPAGLLWLRDSRRIVSGCCARCRYNLHGNESGRCPECGIMPASSACSG